MPALFGRWLGAPGAARRSPTLALAMSPLTQMEQRWPGVAPGGEHHRRRGTGRAGAGKKRMAGFSPRDHGYTAQLVKDGNRAGAGRRAGVAAVSIWGPPGHCSGGNNGTLCLCAYLFSLALSPSTPPIRGSCSDTCHPPALLLTLRGSARHERPATPPHAG